jgi:predicted trehalose synthase
MSELVNRAAGALDPAFLRALEAVSSADWAAWFGDLPSAGPGDAPERRVVATFPLPPSGGLAAICLLESRMRDGQTSCHQAALRFTTDTVPEGGRLLRQLDTRDASATNSKPGDTRPGDTRPGDIRPGDIRPDDIRPGALVGAWSDPGLCAWLREALSAGASIRFGGWEWLAAPERPSIGNTTNGSARQIPARRHDVVLFEPGAVAIVYSGLTRGAQPELDLLRHLERVPGVRVSPTLLGSAIIRSPEGQRTASAALEDLIPGAATVRSVIVGRLHRALDGDPSLQASALDDVRAVGVIARELHAALGRPLEQGVVAGAEPATVADVESWVARTWTTLAAASDALRAATGGAATGGDTTGANTTGANTTGANTTLKRALDGLPAKLQQFAAAAETAPGLVHRIHGNLRLDTVLMAPPRRLSVVEFDGDPFLPESERAAPQSPWRDVARLLVSLAEAAAEAAGLAGGDEKAFEIAWLWEREARKACLEGYGSGGGALHALLAIGELEFASRHLLDAIARKSSTVVAEHILQRLTRTIV